MQRHSHKRDAILEAFRSTKSHPSAEWVYNEVKKKITNLSLATVYRCIAAFRRNNLIVSISTVGGQERFDANTEPHPHFICTKCDAVIDIDLYNMFFDTNEIDRSYNFEVESHLILFYGKCDKCRS